LFGRHYVSKYLKIKEKEKYKKTANLGGCARKINYPYLPGHVIEMMTQFLKCVLLANGCCFDFEKNNNKEGLVVVIKNNNVLVDKEGSEYRQVDATICLLVNGLDIWLLFMDCSILRLIKVGRSRSWSFGNSNA